MSRQIVPVIGMIPIEFTSRPSDDGAALLITDITRLGGTIRIPQAAQAAAMCHQLLVEQNQRDGRIAPPDQVIVQYKSGDFTICRIAAGNAVNYASMDNTTVGAAARVGLAAWAQGCERHLARMGMAWAVIDSIGRPRLAPGQTVNSARRRLAALATSGALPDERYQLVAHQLPDNVIDIFGNHVAAAVWLEFCAIATALTS